jgi:hypothetical protein
MDGTPTSDSPMILVLLDTHGQPQILLGDQAGPGQAGVSSNGSKPEARLQ